jgi:hypothetical protein
MRFSFKKKKEIIWPTSQNKHLSENPKIREIGLQTPIEGKQWVV